MKYIQNINKIYNEKYQPHCHIRFIFSCKQTSKKVIPLLHVYSESLLKTDHTD